MEDHNTKGDDKNPPLDPVPPIFQKLSPKTRGYLAQTIKARKEKEEASDMGGANEQTLVPNPFTHWASKLMDACQIHCDQARWRPGMLRYLLISPKLPTASRLHVLSIWQRGLVGDIISKFEKRGQAPPLSTARSEHGYLT